MDSNGAAVPGQYAHLQQDPNAIAGPGHYLQLQHNPNAIVGPGQYAQFQHVPNDIVGPDHYTQPREINVITGSASSYRTVMTPSGFIPRPLMLNAWSQTTGDDFGILNMVDPKTLQSEREKELEEQIKVLHQSLKAHTELLSQIHATSARTSTILGQQQSQNQQDINTSGFNNNNDNKSISSRATHPTPKAVLAINSSQQVNCSPAESVKYRIVADGTGNHTNERIEIQLAEEDGALNLNGSADSGRLEICLPPEENIEIKTEYNASSNIITQHHAASTTSNPILNENYAIKKRKLSPKQKNLPTTSEMNENMQQKPRKRRSSGKSLLKTPKPGNNQNSIGLHLQTSPKQNIMLPQTNDKVPLVSGTNDTIDLSNVYVTIGPNNTRIPAAAYNQITWTTPSLATRKLLMATFDRKVLATHSMTGKRSPAFPNDPVKEKLDPKIVADIISTVTRNCQVSSKEVRNAITTKCADENKIMKIKMKEVNKENIPE